MHRHWIRDARSRITRATSRSNTPENDIPMKRVRFAVAPGAVFEIQFRGVQNQQRVMLFVHCYHSISPAWNFAKYFREALYFFHVRYTIRFLNFDKMESFTGSRPNFITPHRISFLQSLSRHFEYFVWCFISEFIHGKWFRWEIAIGLDLVV